MPQAGAASMHRPERLRPSLMPRKPRKAGAQGPAAIAIHNNRYMQSALFHKVSRQIFLLPPSRFDQVLHVRQIFFQRYPACICQAKFRAR